ncbi:MAG TPA: EamA family transporter [Gaiellaceae bacterium]|nr:EamA family transporter [Gaiellaceae bacterium]
MAASYGPRVWLALATIYVVWGSTFMAVTIAVRDVPPLLAMGFRHVTAGALLLAFALPRGDQGDRLGWAQIRAGFIFGGALFLLGHGGLAWAQQTIPSGVAALFIGSIPLWMTLLDRVFFGRRLHPSAMLGLVLGFVGLAFLFDPFGEGHFDRVGAVVCVLSALAWAAGSLYSRGAALPQRPLVSAGLAALCGGALLLVAGAASGEFGDLHPTAGSFGAIAYLVVVGTLVGFVAYVWLLRNAPISLVATYAYVNPVIAVALGALLLGEEITAQMLVAGTVILGSVALIVARSGEVREPGRGLRRRPVPVLEGDLQGK